MDKQTCKLTVYLSDGSDGYSAGTWGWIIADGRGNANFDGGWPSKSCALREGRKFLRAVRKEAHNG